jgi:D-beta-D-heptose 7-phosphate kinase/D-beta-D-heptose 1-phosphate adenosyltransferase
MQNELANAKILVVGDVMLDRYWRGPCSRISPEAPVPVINVNKIEQRAGGAGNVALNVSALTGKSGILSIIGDDEPGQSLTEMMASSNIDTHFVTDKHPTITKLRVMSQHQQLLRMDFEEDLSNVDKTPLVEELISQLDDYNVLIVSDYGKGVLSDANTLIQKAREKGLKVLVDPKGSDFSKYRGATLITPNMKEFETVVGPCHSDKEIIDKARELIQKTDLDALLITRSEKGMTLVEKNGNYNTIPTQAQEVFDVTGAGDTVISVMAMGLSIGHDYYTSMNLANAAAGVVVGKLGTATVSPKELYKALNAITQIQTGAVSEEEVIEAMEKCHLQGEKVVMTNGCFDIMHSGHVEYLQKASKLGDRLIVAVNDDASVKRLKGETRPIVSLENRMALLAALECVDWVVAFAEDTPERLINTLLPDILVKGADYEVHQIAGSKKVLANGGEVKTIELRPGCSTSGIIDKIKSQHGV